MWGWGSVGEGGYGCGFMWVSSRMRVWLHVGVGFCG